MTQPSRTHRKYDAPHRIQHVVLIFFIPNEEPKYLLGYGGPACKNTLQQRERARRTQSCCSCYCWFGSGFDRSRAGSNGHLFLSINPSANFFYYTCGSRVSTPPLVSHTTQRIPTRLLRSAVTSLLHASAAQQQAKQARSLRASGIHVTPFMSSRDLQSRN